MQPLRETVANLKPCPQCRRKARLSHQKWDCRQIRRPESLTFLRQCGQGLMHIATHLQVRDRYFCWIRNWSHIATHLVVIFVLLLLLGWLSSKKAKGAVVSNRMGIKKIVTNVLQANSHRSMESNFWPEARLSRWRRKVLPSVECPAPCLMRRLPPAFLSSVYSSWSIVHYIHACL